MNHITVLLNETIDLLDLKDGDVVVDATLGAGGHALQAFTKNPKIKLIGIDLDSYALKSAETRLAEFKDKTKFIQGSFKDIKKLLESNKETAVDKCIFDLGVSSYQIDDSGRGFSFMKDEPLQMTLSDNKELIAVTGFDVVNSWSEETLADIIFGFGEERYARRIAKKIAEAREKNPIKTTFELRDIIVGALPMSAKFSRIHPATKTFQAIRIAVNGELDAIHSGLDGAWGMLNKNGRIAVISFHSLEDRIVKRFMKAKSDEGDGFLITKKPLSPTDVEILQNRRSRSAKLRVIEKIS